MQQQLDLIPAKCFTQGVNGNSKPIVVRVDHLIRLANQIAPPQYAGDTTPGYLAFCLGHLAVYIHKASIKPETSAQRRERLAALHVLRTDPMIQATLAALNIDDVTRLCEV